MDGCASRLQNVDRLMAVSVVTFFERIPQIRESKSTDGWSHLKNGRGRTNRKNHREKHGNTNAEPQALLLRDDRLAASNHVRQTIHIHIRSGVPSLDGFHSVVSSPIHATPADL